MENKDAPDPTRNMSFNLNLTAEQQHARAQVPLPYVNEGTSAFHSPDQQLINAFTGRPANAPSSAAILYDPDSADDIDDDDPDEDLDL